MIDHKASVDAALERDSSKEKADCGGSVTPQKGDGQKAQGRTNLGCDKGGSRCR